MFTSDDHRSPCKEKNEIRLPVARDGLFPDRESVPYQCGCGVALWQRKKKGRTRWLFTLAVAWLHYCAISVMSFSLLVWEFFRHVTICFRSGIISVENSFRHFQYVISGEDMIRISLLSFVKSGLIGLAKY